jgi:hypothetical protein
MADFNWEDLLSGIGNNVVNGVTNAVSNPMLIPAAGTAIQSWNNADKYDTLAKDIKTEANPFGQYRQGYAQQLQSLYNDPNQIMNDPGYRFRLSQGMGVKSGQLGAQHAGWGNEFADMQNYAQGLASTEFDTAAKRLAGLAGANIGPEASVQGQIGLTNAAVNQRGTALQALGSLFGEKPGTTINNGTGNGGNGSWMPNGNYKLPNGDEVDVAKLSAAARLGNPDAIAMLTRISGGATTDQNITDLTTGDIRDGTGTESGDPYNPDGGAGLQGPPGWMPTPEGYDGGDPGWDGGSFTPLPIPDIEANLGDWYDWGGQ